MSWPLRKALRKGSLGQPESWLPIQTKSPAPPTDWNQKTDPAKNNSFSDTRLKQREDRDKRILAFLATKTIPSSQKRKRKKREEDIQFSANDLQASTCQPYGQCIPENQQEQSRGKDSGWHFLGGVAAYGDTQDFLTPQHTS